MLSVFVVGDKYHVVAPLGSGAMGAVYEALHVGTGRRVALKMLRHEIATSESARSRFVREARLVGALASDHIAEVFDAGTDEHSGLPYLVMELLEGPNLKEVLRTRGTLPIGISVVIAAHAASGLAEAHEAGVVHRDVKPANIVLCPTRGGELAAKIVDFGVAKSLEDDAGLTRTGDVVGSFQYMSPEQLRGSEVGASTDIWSLGAVLYEMISGVRPSGDAEAIGVLVDRVCNKGIAPLASVAPQVPAHVADVVDRALVRDPAQRFESAAAFARALSALVVGGTRVPANVLDDRVDVALAPPPPKAAGRPSVSLRTATIGGALAVALTLMFFVVERRLASQPRSSSAADATSAEPVASSTAPATSSANAPEVDELDPTTAPSADSKGRASSAPARGHRPATTRGRSGTLQKGPPAASDPLDHM